MTNTASTIGVLRPEIAQAIRESVYGRIHAGDYTNGIISFYDSECEVRSDGEVVYATNDLARCKKWAERAGLCFEYSKPATAQAKLQAEAPQKAAPARRPRCLHYKTIRIAFAIAKDKGLDTRADEAMRAAFSRVLGRKIDSRDEMSGNDWCQVGRAMKFHGLGW